MIAFLTFLLYVKTEKVYSHTKYEMATWTDFTYSDKVFTVSTSNFMISMKILSGDTTDVKLGVEGYLDLDVVQLE